MIVPGGPAGPGPGADRSIVLWPYSDPEDPRVTFGRGGLRIRAAPGGERLELETLGPLTAMAPGQEVRHQEVWTLRAEATTGGAGS